MTLLIVYAICALVLFFMMVTLYYFWKRDRHDRELMEYFRNRKFNDDIHGGN